MKLIGKSNQIAAICLSFENAVLNVTELAKLSLPVEVLENFDRLPESQQSKAIRDTCAVYRRTTKTIYINQQAFFTLSKLALKILEAERREAKIFSPR